MTNRRAWQLIGVKGAWTTLILFIFLAGRQIPLPFTSLKAVQGTLSGTSQMIMTMTGGDLVQKSLFSLGLGPWMTSMIIVMVLVRSKHLGIAHKPKRVQNRLENGLILLFAVVQALVMVRQMNFTTKTPFVVDGNALVLVAGTFFTVWLSKLNARRGIGGSMFLVMANITQSMAGNLVAVVKVVRQAGWSPELVWSGLIAGIVGFAFLNVIMDRAELRVPVVHLLTDSKYSSDSYLPIKLTPAGDADDVCLFVYCLTHLPLAIFTASLAPEPTFKMVVSQCPNDQLGRSYDVLCHYFCVSFNVCPGER